MNQSNSVTTYIQQKPLLDENKNNDDQSFPFSKSLQLLGIKPNASRTKAFLHLTGDWEGRDALLQFAQSISLLCYSMAPIRRKQLHIASESFANARRIFILGRWLNDGAETIRTSWSASSGKDRDTDDQLSSDDEQEAELELESIQFGGTEDDVLGNAQKQVDHTTRHSSSSYRHNTIRSPSSKQYQKQWRERIGLISEYLTMFGDGCEVVALLGGSSVLWRIIGGRLAARQRHGLERIAQFIFFFAFTFGLRQIELKRQEVVRKLRKANKNLLRASDHVSAEADASTLLQARPLSVTEALSSHNTNPSLIDQQRNRSIANTEQTTLRKAEYKVLMHRKEMQLLRLERTSLRAELLFTIAEIVWPYHDHTRLEGWTTFIASICHMSRLTKQARWH